MNTGGTVHNELKKLGKKILLERGFAEDEIHFEYSIQIGLKNYVVDVAGLKKDYMVAIECGGVSNKDKLTQLETSFHEVFHIPYKDESITALIKQYENRIEELLTEIKNLKEGKKPEKKDGGTSKKDKQGPIKVFISLKEQVLPFHFELRKVYTTHNTTPKEVELAIDALFKEGILK